MKPCDCDVMLKILKPTIVQDNGPSESAEPKSKRKKF